MAEPEKWNLNLIFAIAAAAVGSGFQHGYHTGVINIPQAVFQNWENESYHHRSGKYMDDDVQNILWGLTTSIMNVGGALGGFLTGVMAEKFGPKLGLFLNNIFVIVASLLMIFSQPAISLEMIIIGRFIIGINCGLNSGMGPMYLSEIAPVNLRGAISSVYILMVSISILIAQGVGFKYILGNARFWPYLFVLPLLFVCLQMLMLFFCVESPKYLISIKNNRENTEKSLKFLRKKEDVSKELAILEAEDATIKAQEKVTLKDMFTVRHLKIPLMIALVMMAGQQFSAINIVLFYSGSVFRATGLGEDESAFATLSVGLVNVLMTIVSLYLVELVGRKTLLLVSFGGMAINLALLGVCLYFADTVSAMQYVCIILIVIYIIYFAAGAASIPWFLVTEIFYQDARPRAVSISVPVNWITNFVVTLTFPVLMDKLQSFVFYIYVVLDVLVVVFIWIFVPETKNKSIDEIVSQWKT